MTKTTSKETGTGNSKNLDSSSFSIVVDKTSNKHFYVYEMGKNISENTRDIIINLEKDSNATILFLHSNENSSKLTQTKSIQTTINQKENSKLKIIDVFISKDIEFTQQTNLNEDGSNFQGTVLFLGTKNNQTKIITNVNHMADDTKAKLICKGVLQESSSADFSAKIYVQQNKKDIESHQNMKCLTMGENSKCGALPILDVNSDSVIASHGAAIGRVEDENVYYLQSRGIEEKDARAMILCGLLIQELRFLEQDNNESSEANKFFKKISDVIKQNLGLKQD